MSSFTNNGGASSGGAAAAAAAATQPVDPDQEARLEEFKFYWQDFLEEPDKSELVLAELELNKLCVKYLIRQTRKLAPASKPQSLILNSCKFHPTDGTAALLVQFLQENSKSLQRLRLESAYVGHLPTPTATVLLQGMAQYATRLTSIQLVDIDVRPTAVAHAVARLASSLTLLQNLEFRHCRCDAPFLQTLGQSLVLHRHNKQYAVLSRLTFHACVLEDQLLGALGRELTKQNGTNTNNNNTNATNTSVQALRQLALPSNRLTQGSLPLLTKILTHQSQMQQMDLQRNSRLFWGFASDIISNNNNSSGLVPGGHGGEYLVPLQQHYEQAALLHDFSTALRRHQHLQKLDLHRCGVTDVVARHIFQALEGNDCHLEELNLSGNELSCTWEEEDEDHEEYNNSHNDNNNNQQKQQRQKHWIQSLPKLQSLRILDLPRHASGSHPGWYDAPSTLASRLERHHPDHVSHQSRQTSSSSSPLALRSPFVQHLYQNTSLHALLHDGQPSLKADAVVQRNMFLQRAQTHQQMLLNAIQLNLDRIVANQNNQWSGVLLNNHGNMMTNWDALWPSLLQHYTLQLEASSGLYLLLQDALSSSPA